MAIGRSSSVYSAYSSVRSIPRTRPSALTISVTTRPQPPCLFTRRRNAVSVMPAIGAMASGDGRSTAPILMELVGLRVGRVDFDRDRLADEIHGQHEAGAMRVLPHQPADDALQRAVNHFDHHAFADHRAWIVLELAADEQPDAVQLEFGNRRRLSLERHDVDDAGALENGKRVGWIEPREAVAGKQRPVDLLLAILPAAPPGNRRQERFELLAFELLADDLLVSRPRPDCIPLHVRRHPGISVVSVVSVGPARL